MLEIEKALHNDFDKESFLQVQNYSFSATNTLTELEMKKAIKKREDSSFVIAYELLKDSKVNRDKSSQFLKNIISSPHHNTLLEEI